ncbi:MAG: hypothetical protein PHY93_09565, partial [Bacteriovorax sp.]|nr:hypothetical protein [Bacteriovorax sp.]
RANYDRLLVKVFTWLQVINNLGDIFIEFSEFKMERITRIELATFSMASKRSTTATNLCIFS